MNSYRKYFYTAIRITFASSYDEIVAALENEYNFISVDTKFARKSKNPIDRRLDFCAYFLALIKTLESRGEHYESIRRISLQIVTDYVKPKNKFQEWVKRIPAKLLGTWMASRLIRVFNSKVSKNDNKAGFIANIITDKQETFGLGYGVDIIECGICKLFNQHYAEKYTPILCEVDKLTSQLAASLLYEQEQLQLVQKNVISDSKKSNNRYVKEYMNTHLTKDGRAFEIRQPNENDAENLINYSKIIFASTDQVLTILEEYRMTVENEKSWISNLTQNPNAQILIAELDNQIVGFLFFIPNSKRKNAHTGEFGVNVHPDFQRIGIGRHLISRLLSWAKNHARIEKVYLTVFVTNIPAIKLYSAMGFMEEGRHIKAIKQLSGEYVDVLQMYVET